MIPLFSVGDHVCAWYLKKYIWLNKLIKSSSSHARVDDWRYMLSSTNMHEINNHLQRQLNLQPTHLI